MAFSDVIRLHARHRSSKVALVHGEKQWTYAQLDAAVDAVCWRLTQHGVHYGELVGVSLQDTAEHLLMLLALSRIGAVILPVDRRWHVLERLSVCEHFDARWILVEPDDPLEHADVVRVDASWYGSSAKPYRDERVVDSTPLLLSLSSGTTGMPKGPRATHLQFESRFLPYWVDLGFTSRDRYVSATPLYFGGGRGFSLAMLYAGATVFMFPPPYEPRQLIEYAARVQATQLFLVPTLLRRILAADFEGLAFPTVTKLVSSGSMLHMEERLQIKRRLTDNLFELYASTEGGSVSMLSPQDFHDYPDSVGRPVFRVDVAIVDNNHEPLPPGQIGRLRYRSPASAHSYYKGDSAEAFHEDWFYPGDLALMNDQGYIYLKGRSKDMIIRGGVNIYPGDVESVLIEAPQVSDAAVVGVPSAELGEEIVAFVVTKSAVTQEDLIKLCRGRLASYKVPRTIYFVESFPKNAMGKTLKAELIRQLPL